MRFIILFFLLFSFSGNAQNFLGISTIKTTSLVFPFPVTHVDRGSKNVVVQPVEENPTILLVKAAEKDFPETNLSVVTSDGSVYGFTIVYQEHPKSWIYNLQPGKNVPLPFICTSLLYNLPIQKHPSKEKWNLQITVSGIYISDQHFFLQLEAENKSPIGYDIDFLRLSVKDGKKTRRTAEQEVVQNPLFIAGNTKEIRAFSKTVLVVALEKFTIPDKKYFSIEMGEKNGGRQLELKIKNRHLLKAKLLPQSQ
jgi:hypothetical protein